MPLCQLASGLQMWATLNADISQISLFLCLNDDDLMFPKPHIPPGWWQRDWPHILTWEETSGEEKAVFKKSNLVIENFLLRWVEGQARFWPSISQTLRKNAPSRSVEKREGKDTYHCLFVPRTGSSLWTMAASRLVQFCQSGHLVIERIS